MSYDWDVVVEQPAPKRHCLYREPPTTASSQQTRCRATRSIDCLCKEPPTTPTSQQTRCRATRSIDTVSIGNSPQHQASTDQVSSNPLHRHCLCRKPPKTATSQQTRCRATRSRDTLSLQRTPPQHQPVNRRGVEQPAPEKHCLYRELPTTPTSQQTRCRATRSRETLSL